MYSNIGSLKLNNTETSIKHYFISKSEQKKRNNLVYVSNKKKYI